VTGGSDLSLRLWDADSGNELLRLAGHLGDISATRFSADGKPLATSSSDGMVLLWNVTPLGQLGKRPLWKFASDGQTDVWQRTSTILSPRRTADNSGVSRTTLGHLKAVAHPHPTERFNRSVQSSFAGLVGRCCTICDRTSASGRPIGVLSDQRQSANKARNANESAVGRSVADAQRSIDVRSIEHFSAIYHRSVAGFEPLRSIGYQPTWYQIPEAAAEVALALTAHESRTRTASSPPRRREMCVLPVDAGYQSRFSYQLSTASSLTFRIVPIPLPAVVAQPETDTAGTATDGTDG
jgi:hypothetical protein